MLRNAEEYEGLSKGLQDEGQNESAEIYALLSISSALQELTEAVRTKFNT